MKHFCFDGVKTWQKIMDKLNIADMTQILCIENGW